MNPLVSVIVPVYNSEDYLEQCVKSLIGQTYNNLEIILVDDGSTDKSGAICEYFKSCDGRIIVIHQENRGVSYARNTALMIAKGEWISFVDSDDTVELTYIERLWQLCYENNVQVSLCGGHKKNDDNENEISILTTKEYMLNHQKQYAVWGHLWNRKLFENIFFPIGKLSEDVAIIYKLLYRAKEIVISTEKLYHVTKREGSLSRPSERIGKCEIDKITILRDKAVFFESINEPELSQKAWTEYYMNLLEVINYHANKSDDSILKRTLMKEYRAYFKKLKNNKMLTKHLKYILIIAYVYPSIWKFVS